MAKQKPLIPAKYCGEWRCAIPESGDSFTMYALRINGWSNYPVRIERAKDGTYLISGEIVSAEEVIRDQRPITTRIKLAFLWRKIVSLAK